jgi:hypothetical protein
VGTGRRSGNTPPNQTKNEEDIDPVLLNPSEEEKYAWLSEVHNLFVGHMGFHRTMKNLKHKGERMYIVSSTSVRIAKSSTNGKITT